YLGRPTGSAMPLMWAHAEYIKLLRSTADGELFDLIPEVADRYRNGRKRRPLEIWKVNRQVPVMAVGATLRVQALKPFLLHWTNDEWRNARDTSSSPVPTGFHFVDVTTKAGDHAPLRFTFRWRENDRWEGRDYMVELKG
ncbi:MAG: glycoside hydrolase family 15 protein, partial [Candidatus Binataceae bacterium]